MFVHDVMAAIATAPCSIAAGRRRGVAGREIAGASLAGKDSWLASSTSSPLSAGRPLSQHLGQHALETTPGAGQRNAVLRTTRAGQRRFHRGQIEPDQFGVAQRGLRVVPQALLLGVALHSVDEFGVAARKAQVVQGDLVDREDRAGGAELGAHVRQRRPIGEGNRSDRRAGELHEAPDDAVSAQHLRDRQHQIRRRDAWPQLAQELQPDDRRDQGRHRQAEHRRLRLDPPDTPAQHAQPVDHRRVRVRPDQSVGERPVVP